MYSVCVCVCVSGCKRWEAKGGGGCLWDFVVVIVTCFIFCCSQGGRSIMGSLLILYLYYIYIGV